MTRYFNLFQMMFVYVFHIVDLDSKVQYFWVIIISSSSTVDWIETWRRRK